MENPEAASALVGAPITMPVAVSVDTTEVNAGLSELAAFADRFPELIQHLVSRRETLTQLFRVDVDRTVASGAHEIRAQLKPTEFLVHLLAALRALDRDRLITEITGHQ